MRAAAVTHADAFLTRTMTPVEIVSEEGLADDHRQRRDDPRRGRHRGARLPVSTRPVRRRRVRHRRRACALSPWARPLARRHGAGELRAARPQPRPRRHDRRRRHGVRSQLRLAVRPRPRQRPALRHARRLPELRQADLLVTPPPPLRRDGVRAGRRPGQQAPPRHGVQPPALQRQADHGLGDCRRAGGRLGRARPHRVRR